MRRQRSVFTLSSQADTSFFQDSDSMSILSNHYSCPETVWSPITSPEPDTLIPYYIYPYPFLETPVEPISFITEFFNPSLTPDSFQAFDDIYLNNDYLPNDAVINNFFCTFPYEDGIITQDLPPCTEAPANENVDDILHKEPKPFPRITNYGTVTIMLRHLIRVDISPTKAVYVTNSPSSCIVAVDETGDNSCVIHPNGRVHHVGQDVHMVTLDRRAKICTRGVIFSSVERCLSYLVDDSGTKTSSEKLRNLNHDFSLKVFYRSGPSKNSFDECHKLVNETKYKSYKNGDEVWMIGGFRIKQDQRGDVKITKKETRFMIRTSPTTGEVFIKTFAVEISIGRYPHSYFVVRKGNKQVTASLKCFNVQHGSQKAGFNSCGKVVLF